MSRTKTATLAPMPKTKTLLAATLATLLMLAPPPGRAADIVATIAPLHSLVQGVMGETGDARLLLPASQTPHGAHLKPSQMKALHDAGIVFYIAGTFESFLKKAFKALPASVRGVALAEEIGAASGDPHIWLDPQTASRAVQVIARHLSDAAPQNRATYEANALALASRLAELDKDLRRRLEPVRGRPFAVFHDAYQHFTRRYDLSVVAVLSPGGHDHHHGGPTIARIREVSETIRRTGALCVFHEPQFPARAVRALSEDLNINSGALDPLGAGLETGDGLYFRLLENLADGILGCLLK